MTLFIRRFLACVAILILWSGVCAAQAVSDTAPSTLAGEWSAVVDGVRGRLLRTWYAEDGAMQLRIDLELENVRQVLNPIEIRWARIGRMLDLALEDSTGTSLPRFSPAGNEWSPLPYVLALPYGSTIRISLSAAALERKDNGDSALLRPLVFQAWNISVSSLPDLYLSGVFRAGEVPSANSVPSRTSIPSASRNTWEGSLQLPPVALR